jgi:hypothetical protein
MTAAEIARYRLEFHRFQQSREKAYTPKIERALKVQINQFITAVQGGYSEAEALTKVTAEPLLKVLQSLYIDAATKYGAKVRVSLNRLPMQQKAGGPIGFNRRMTELVLRYFRVDFLNDVEEMTAYTRELIQKVLTKAYALGWSFDEILKYLPTAPALTRIRARRIARTETVGAANFGADAVARDSGLKLNKVWSSVNDIRTRHDHRNVDGQKVGMDDTFNVGGFPMKYPGDKAKGKTPAKEIVNCRCTVIHEPVRDKDGKLVEA